MFQCGHVQEGLGQISSGVWEGEEEMKSTFVLLFILNVYIFVLYQASLETALKYPVPLSVSASS